MGMFSARNILRAGVLTGSILPVGKMRYQLIRDPERLYLYDLKLVVLSDMASKIEFMDFTRGRGIFINLNMECSLEEVIRTLTWEDIICAFGETGKIIHRGIEFKLKGGPVELIPILVDRFWDLGLHPAILPYTDRWVIQLLSGSEIAEFCKCADKLLPPGMYAPLKKKIRSFAVVASREMRNMLREICTELLPAGYLFEYFPVTDIPKFIGRIVGKKRICTFGAPTKSYLSISRDFGHRLLIFDSRIAPNDAELIMHQSDPGACHSVLKKYFRRVLRG